MGQGWARRGGGKGDGSIRQENKGYYRTLPSQRDGSRSHSENLSEIVMHVCRVFMNSKLACLGMKDL